MKAIILAAGDSKRLRPLTDEMPKCLLEIGGQSILDYQIRALMDNCVTEVTVVVGYLAEKIMRHLTLEYPAIRFKFIYNPIYSNTNTVYSLWLASHEMDCDFLYFNADVLMDKRIIKKLIDCKYDNCLTINPQRCGDEEVKVMVKNNLISDIGKELEPNVCYGEFMGIAKFSNELNREFKNRLNKIINEGKVNAFFELALKELISETKSKLGMLDIQDLPCIEIDTPEDLEIAINEICNKLID